MKPRPVVVISITVILLAVVFAAGLIGVSVGAKHSRDALKDQADAKAAAIQADLDRLKATSKTNDTAAAAQIAAFKAALRRAGIDPATVVVVITPQPTSGSTPAANSSPSQSTPAPHATPRPTRTASPRSSPTPTCTRLPVVNRCLR